MTSISRRRFMRTAGTATAALVAGGAIDRYSAFAATSPFVRRNVASLGASDPTIVSYKTAIAAMQALPSTDPRSWAYQAAIHGTILAGALTSWSSCEHYTPFFLSWHRMYLWYFERIVRAMSGDSNWALPYWDYPATSGKLPVPFRDPADATNPLYVAARGFGWNDGTAFLAASSMDSTVAMANLSFDGFQSTLEGTPHGAVHVSIGGWMATFTHAGEDPIFWLHHANIDRLWNLWLTQGGGRRNPIGVGTADLNWQNRQFTFFNESGAPVKISGCQILRAQKQLNYIYECEPQQVEEVCFELPCVRCAWHTDVIYALRTTPVVLPPQLPQVALDFDVRPVSDTLKTVAADPAREVVLQLKGIEADRQPDMYWEIYVANAFVGTLSLFGQGIRDGGHHHEFRPVDLSLRIDDAINAAVARDPNLTRLPILFVASGPKIEGGVFQPTAGATLTIGSLAIAQRQETGPKRRSVRD